MRLRAKACDALRAFFQSRDFLEVDTPQLVPCPGVEPHLDAFSLQSDPQKRYLITSPEPHMKRLLAAGSGPIFQLTHAFRRGEHGDRHNPEFSILEWYRPHGDYLSMLQDTCELILAISEALGLGSQLRWGGHCVDLAAPAQVWTVEEAFQRYAGCSVESLRGDERDADFSRLMVDHIEPQLGIHSISALKDYPADMASLARLKPSDPSVAERLEVYVAGIELANAFSELTDPVEQRARMENELDQRRRLGLDCPPLDERFLESLEKMPPAGGIALGIDRLVMLLSGAEDVRDVMSFPWDAA